MFNKNLLPSTVGFDRLFSTFDEFERLLETKPVNFPPYNIVKLNDNSYAIEIAVAGFSIDDIDVEVKMNKLTVTGKSSSDEVENKEYLFRGLSRRDFKREFILVDTVVVKSANIVNGVLCIYLENVIPEEKMPRKIQIGVDSKVLLEESKKE